MENVPRLFEDSKAAAEVKINRRGTDLRLAEGLNPQCTFLDESEKFISP